MNKCEDRSDAILNGLGRRMEFYRGQIGQLVKVEDRFTSAGLSRKSGLGKQLHDLILRIDRTLEMYHTIKSYYITMREDSDHQNRVNCLERYPDSEFQEAIMSKTEGEMKDSFYDKLINRTLKEEEYAALMYSCPLELERWYAERSRRGGNEQS